MHNVIAAGGGFFYLILEGLRMSCKFWRCLKLDDDMICEDLDTECIGDLCDEYKQCSTCNKQDEEDCPEY